MFMFAEKSTLLPNFSLKREVDAPPQTDELDLEYTNRLNKIGRSLYGIVSVTEAKYLSEQIQDEQEDTERLMRIADIAINHGFLKTED